MTIGVLTPLFGTAPEDEEVGRIVRDALEDMRALGAGIVEMPFPGLDELLQNTSVINAEFKFDLLDFLAKYPAAPVHSLGEISSSGKYHPAVEGVLKRANDVPSRDSATYRATLADARAARQTCSRR